MHNINPSISRWKWIIIFLVYRSQKYNNAILRPFFSLTLTYCSACFVVTVLLRLHTNKNQTNALMQFDKNYFKRTRTRTRTRTKINVPSFTRTRTRTKIFERTRIELERKLTDPEVNKNENENYYQKENITGPKQLSC